MSTMNSGPSRARGPVSSGMMRSAIINASSTSFVISSTVLRCSLQMRPISSCRFARVSASSADSGSSISSTSGSVASARATDTRWRMPPDSSARLLVDRGRQPDHRNVVQHALGAHLGVVLRKHAIDRQRHVLAHGQPRHQRIALEHHAAVRARCGDRLAVLQHLAAVGLDQTREQADQRRLATAGKTRPPRRTRLAQCAG